MSLFNKIFIIYLILIISLFATILVSNIQYYIIVIAISCLTFCIIIIYFYGVFEATNNLFVKTIKGKEFFENQNGILFRFDDGPDPVYTPQILDILKEHNIRGFFAVTGEKSQKFPNILTRIANEGHMLGNHSYSHSYLISLYSKKKLLNDLSECNKIIEQTTGKRVRYYCPPMGHKSLALKKVIEKLQLEVLAWDIKTCDTKLEVDEIIKRIKLEIKDKSSIILFHDGIYKWTKPNRDATIDSLKEIIIYIKSLRGS